MSTMQHAAGLAGTFTLGGDLRINRMGFGAMRLTGDGIWGPPSDRELARAVLHRALDLGVNFIDTADSYGPEVSEQIIAEALHPYPSGLVIATKGGNERPGPNRWTPNGRPEHLREACEGSLRRLKLDSIDLYQLHVPDPQVPFEESLGALVDLQRDGKIRHIGLSNVDVDQLRRAQGMAQIVSVQNRYNLNDRESEDVLTACEQDNLGFIPWRPLGDESSNGTGTSPNAVASRLHATPGQISIAWLLRRSPVMLLIPGTSKLDHLEDNVAAAEIELSQQEFELLGQ